MRIPDRVPSSPRPFAAVVAGTFALAGAFALALMIAALLPGTTEVTAQETFEGALKVTHGGPVYECLPGKSVFWDNVPENVRTREKVESKSLASNEVAKVEGKFKLDLEAPDPLGLSSPKPPEIECRFKRSDGSSWAFFPSREAVVERGSMPPSFKVFAFGQTSKGTPLEPRQGVVLRLRGTGRIEKDGKSLASDVLFSLVVGSQTRNPDDGQYRGGYESSHDGLEVKLAVPETYQIPGSTKGLTVVFTRALASKS